MNDTERVLILIEDARRACDALSRTIQAGDSHQHITETRAAVERIRAAITDAETAPAGTVRVDGEMVRQTMMVLHNLSGFQAISAEERRALRVLSAVMGAAIADAEIAAEARGGEGAE